MHVIDYGFWGMHLFWWLFWVVFMFVIFGLLTPVPRHKVRDMPLQILQRRYAAGEISTQEYEERKGRLQGAATASRR